MKTFHDKSSGFTMIELLIVTAMLAVVVGATYSLYLTHLRTAYSHDEVVDVQQNLRIAMDSITRDLKMGGLLVPKGDNLNISLSNCTEDSLRINTTSPNGGFARITPSAATTGDYSTTGTSFTLSVDGFNINDKVRILSTFDKSQPLKDFLTSTTSLVVTAVHRGDLDASPVDRPSITVEIYNVPATGAHTPSGTLLTGAVIRPCYVITKAAGAGVDGYDGITYRLVDEGVANNCPVGKCLARQPSQTILPAPKPEEIVASNLTRLHFDYLPDDPAIVETVAVRVTLTGATARNTGAAGWTPQTRDMTSIIKLRN
jgi:prepilin-type N-terminal cleavage/methylation domain-containing protein